VVPRSPSTLGCSLVAVQSQECVLGGYFFFAETVYNLRRDQRPFTLIVRPELLFTLPEDFSELGAADFVS
jgi:hypothetical protein